MIVLLFAALNAVASVDEKINSSDVCKCHFIRENDSQLLVSISINKDVIFNDQATINFRLRDANLLLLDFSCLIAKDAKVRVNGVEREEVYGWDFTISPELIGKMELITFFSYKNTSYKLVIKSSKNSDGEYVPIISIMEYHTSVTDKPSSPE